MATVRDSAVMLGVLLESPAEVLGPDFGPEAARHGAGPTTSWTGPCCTALPTGRRSRRTADMDRAVLSIATR
jgi:hypothetical protein